MDYSKTVNLLQTAFPMKADLPVRELLFLDQWQKEKLYERMQEKGKDDSVFLLHDGPPYANGPIHTGHALNKILKDFVVKYKTMAGFRAPYRPGWDCHGLPIEHALFKQLGKRKNEVSRQELRTKATEYALGFVDKQRSDFKRLGILGEWENPYLTLSKDYEARIVEVFFELWEKGFVYRGLKPGYWCASDETALAEAEVEYADKKSDSVYVKFKVKPETIPPAVNQQMEVVSRADKEHEPVNGKALNVLIWTTTPWTLPANTGLAFHPTERYAFIQAGHEDFIVAGKLTGKVLEILRKKFPDASIRGGSEIYGRDFLGMKAENPLHGRESRAVNAAYVTMEDGTGIVHIAPGHGMEDFAVGQEYGLDVLSPVDERGRFDQKVGRPELIGKSVLKDANQEVMQLLGENLMFHFSFSHSYPHCWRCKNPVIFRATEQWFLRVDTDFREKLLKEIDRVRWEPAYGIHRIQGMVTQRPDWCLSRQRHWGAPIAVFYCKKCREPLLDPKVNRRVVDLIMNEGTNAWYDRPEAELLKNFKPVCAKCGGTDFVKETDILDVWFDSGVSWHAVVEADFAEPKPQTIMYLEGSDQHRGWFQTSLIPSVALRNKAPYDLVLTHGFVMDGKGYKMSKSLGNVIAPQEIIEKYGADILRLWVAMSDYREDVRLSQDIIKHMIDVYRRFRNTFRFLLQNTSDFRWNAHRVPDENLDEIDRWILAQFEDVKTRVVKAYEAYEFHVVLSELNRFVSVPLSGFYLDAMKDRLYCDALDSTRRRSAQTAFFELLRGLSVLLAPLLSFTSEEAYLELRKVSHPSLPDSVFLDEISALTTRRVDEALLKKWTKIFEIRSVVNDELDRQRKAGVLKSSQEAAVRIDPSKMSLDNGFSALPKEDWPFLLQMAEVQFTGPLDGGSAVAITATKHGKCERCWRCRADVGARSEHPTLCGRCADVVSTLDGIS